MNTVTQIFQSTMLYLCVGALIALGVWCYFRTIDSEVRKLLSHAGGGLVLVWLLVFGWHYAGMSCNHSRVTVPRTDPDAQYLYDNGSYITNTHAYISFTSLFLPDDAQIIVAYAPCRASNESQVVKLDSMALAQWKEIDCTKTYQWDMSWGDRADDYHWYLYTTWVPAPAVHTNGVLNCFGIARDRNISAGVFSGVTKRTIVTERGKIISPDSDFWDFNDELNEIQNAPVYGGEERIPYELEKYFDINR